jgi:hypothetical protein
VEVLTTDLEALIAEAMYYLHNKHATPAVADRTAMTDISSCSCDGQLMKAVPSL